MEGHVIRRRNGEQERRIQRPTVTEGADLDQLPEATVNQIKDRARTLARLEARAIRARIARELFPAVVYQGRG